MHKVTSEPVAIKMIQKKDLSPEDLKNILTEIKVSGNVDLKLTRSSTPT